MASPSLPAPWRPWPQEALTAALASDSLDFHYLVPCLISSPPLIKDQHFPHSILLPDILEKCFSTSFDVFYKLHLISCLGISDLK